MESWDKLAPNELDALVAERVMGWTLSHRGNWWNGANGRNVYSVEMWRPSTCSDCDLFVLGHVREAWKEGRLVRFVSELHRLYVERLRVGGFDTSRFSRHVFSALMDHVLCYRPGDYSRAALAALDASELKGEEGVR